MSLEEKIRNAKETTWLTDGLKKEEIAEIKSKAIEEARKELAKIKENNNVSISKH